MKGDAEGEAHPNYMASTGSLMFKVQQRRRLEQVFFHQDALSLLSFLFLVMCRQVVPVLVSTPTYASIRW